LKFNEYKKKCLSQGSDCKQSKKEKIVIFHHSIEIFINQAKKERGRSEFRREDLPSVLGGSSVTF
jgi:hypothetical protein